LVAGSTTVWSYNATPRQGCAAWPRLAANRRVRF
jgi:hypothetical protein